MGVDSRCTQCGATSLSGVLVHAQGCQDLEEPTIGITGQIISPTKLLIKARKLSNKPSKGRKG